MEIIKNYESCNLDWPIVVGVRADKIESLKKEYYDIVKDLKDVIEFSVGKIHTIYPLGKIINRKMYLVGLGNDDITDLELKLIFLNLGKVEQSTLMVDLDSFGNQKKTAFIATYELNYGNYYFDDYQSSRSLDELSVRYISSVDVTKEIEEALNISTAVNNARDLINTPYNHLNASDLALYAQELVKELNTDKVSIEIYDKKQIEEMKMGAFLGVNKGSKDEPKLIYIKYQGEESWENVKGLVGKGVMFDTGGYSLKTSMVNMKCDMAGAASVLAVLEALVKNEVKCNVVLVIAATDNRINGEALLPDDIIFASNGTSIEIVSTDAEGRLTLADALLFAQKQGATEVIDIATLTGACVAALGEYTTGIFGNNQSKIEKFIKSALSVYENVWQLPITAEIRKKVRSSKVADLTNSTGRLMGASGAAAFLEAFIKDNVDWIHLDIAGTAFHTTPNAYEKYGATGIMIKSIYNYLKGE